MPEKQIYRFNDIEVDLSRGCLTRAGEERHLRQKAFQVLVHLLESRARLVPKRELFDDIWKDVAVTDDVLVQCVKEIRRVIGDDPQNPQYIKTVLRSGYRFIAEVTEEPNGSHLAPEVAGSKSDTTLRRPLAWRRYSLAVLLVTVALLSAGYYFGWPFRLQSHGTYLSQTGGRKTVAVISFENQSGNAELDWLREGLADMLAAGLSRSDKLALLDRGQLYDLIQRFDRKNEKISLDNAREIALQARAENFITGSFAQLGERLRVDVQLRDAQTGDLVTTESLTVEKTDQILSEIDLLSRNLSNRLNAGANEKQPLTSVMTNNLEAYRYYSLGVEKAHGLENKEAIDLLKKAIALDPDFAMAQARIGYTYAVSWAQTEKGKPYLEKAFLLSSRLTEKDQMNIAAWYAIANLDFQSAITSYREIINRFPFEIEAYWRLGRLLAGEERPDEAIEVLQRGIAVDPGAKYLYNILGTVLAGQSKHAEAIAAHERYVALAPDEPNAYDSLGLTLQWSGDYERAIENFERALSINPRFDVATMHLANAKIRLGQFRVAIAILDRYIADAPSKQEKRRGYECLAFIYLEKGDLALAEKNASQTRNIDPDQMWNAYLLAVKRGRTAEAKHLETDILAKSTSHDRGARSNARFDEYHKGIIALNNGRNDDAVKSFQRLLLYAPPLWNHLDFEDSLGFAFLKIGRYDEAISEFQRVLQIAANYPLAHFHMAQAYGAKGMPDQAKEGYQAFLEVWKNADTDLPQVIKARKFLRTGK